VANIKSQIKRNRTNEKARVRNLAVRSRLKTLARRFREAVTAGDKAKAETALQEACRAYDKAAAAGVIHANNAANHKARLTKAFNRVA
jgi:small subunit ribosomal protein S20